MLVVGVLVLRLAPSPPADLPLGRRRRPREVPLHRFKRAVPPRHPAHPTPTSPEPPGLA